MFVIIFMALIILFGGLYGYMVHHRHAEAQAAESRAEEQEEDFRSGVLDSNGEKST